MLRFLRQALRVLVVLGVAVVLLLIGLRLAARLRETQSNLQAAPSTGRFITAADIGMYVQELGPAGGPAVLFISGLGAWSETWRPTMSALAAAGYRSIAIDLPPFGYSFRPRDASYGTDAQARRVVAALDALHVRDVVLVGHSFGGRATVEGALRLPGRVRALVLVDAALGLQSSDEEPVALLRLVLDHEGLRNTLVAATATNPWLTYRFLSSFTAKHDALTDERVAIYQRPLTQTGTTEAYGGWLREFMAPGERLLSRDRGAYATLDMPALLLWGDRDTVTPLAQGEDLARLLPRATLRVVPGAGHIPHLEDNAAFNAALLSFLHAVPSLTAAAPGR